MLAMRSVRQRPGRFLATLLAAFLGAGIIMTFNSLYDTASRPGVDPVSSQTLTTSASVVGGYGTLLVFFAVASTMTVNVRQRAGELELLRCYGCDVRGKIRRMVVGEAVAVALLGAARRRSARRCSAARALLTAFQDGGQVAESVEPPSVP